MKTDDLSLNETIHAPKRLSICAFLSAVDEAEFSVLRDALHLSDSVLSKHLATLSSAGFVTTRKVTSRGRARTWIRLTDVGRSTYASHLAALRELLGL